jgi:DNA-binding winged helix-turn-helix (wHTH) protein
VKAAVSTGLSAPSRSRRDLTFARKELDKKIARSQFWQYVLHVDSTATARLAWLAQSREVAVLHWPAEAEEANRLDQQGIPRLLLVESGATPPLSDSCLEDWLMVPASDLEVETRLVNLAKRTAHHPRPPMIDDFGRLTHRGRSLFLSPLDQRLAQALVENFGAIVEEPELIKKVWPEGARNQVLRVHVSRLRQRLAPLELTIKCVRNTGYLIAEAGTLDPRAVPTSEP